MNKRAVCARIRFALALGQPAAAQNLIIRISHHAGRRSFRTANFEKLAADVTLEQPRRDRIYLEPAGLGAQADRQVNLGALEMFFGRARLQLRRATGAWSLPFIFGGRSITTGHGRADRRRDRQMLWPNPASDAVPVPNGKRHSSTSGRSCGSPISRRSPGRRSAVSAQI